MESASTSRKQTNLGFPLVLVGVLERAHPILVAPRLGGDAFILQRQQHPVLAIVCRCLLLQRLTRQKKTHNKRVGKCELLH